MSRRPSRIADSIPQRHAEDYTALVDGYNAIKRRPEWRRLTPTDGREHLLRRLETIRWPVPVRRTVVIFDGPSDEAARGIGSNLDIRFARSADACIQEAIRSSASPSRLLIVSNDREILATAKSHGAHSYSIDWLFDHSGQAAPRQQARHAAPEKSSLPAADARRITEELAKRWLDRSTGSA